MNDSRKGNPGRTSRCLGGLLHSTWVACALFLLPLSVLLPVRAAENRQTRELELIRVLNDSRDWAARDKACRELQVMGTRACIPALAGLLTDPTLSHIARVALEPMPYPEAGAALCKAVGETQGDVKVGLINSVGIRRDPAVVALLISLLKAGDSRVAGAAATALGRVGTPDAVTALAAFRQSAPPALREAAAQASLLAAERRADNGDGVSAATIYAALQAPEWPEHIRLGAFVGLLSAQPDQAAVRILQAVSGSDPTRRAAAIAGLTHLEAEGLVEQFTAELPTLEPAVQTLLVDALADRKKTAVRTAILDLGKTSGDQTVRLAAARALGKVGDASCVPWLTTQVGSAKTRQERDTATVALLALTDPAVSVALTHCMTAAGVEARPHVINVLLRRNDVSAVAALLEQAEVEDGAVRQAAFRALARLADPTSLPRLIALLVGAPADAARSEAERAVAQVALKIADDATRAETVLDALARQRDVDKRGALLRTLTRIAGEQALGAVQKALVSPDPEERDVALRALATWPDAIGVEPLFQQFRTSDNATHRALALRACVRLLSPPTQLAPEACVAWYRRGLESANDAAEQKLLLGGLMHVPHPDALALAMEQLDDPAVSAEAGSAAVGIGRALIGISPEVTVTAMQRMAKDGHSPAVRKQAKELLRSAEQFEDYIVSWHVAGPYRQAGKQGKHLIDVSFPPEQEGGAQAQWRALPAKSRTKQPWMLDLAGSLGGVQCLAYARTWIESDREQTVRLEMGVDDAIKAWLNGKVVHANNSSGAAKAGEEKIPVVLNKGWNILVLKVIQHTGPWEYCARFRSEKGAELDGIRIDANHAGRAPVLDPPKVAPTIPVVSLSLSQAGPPPTGKEAGWQSLFNGKDLAGWDITGAAIATVEDGCLVGTQTTGKGGDLWCQGTYGNVELLVTYRVRWPANTGIWFRYQGGGKAYQFDILKYKKPVAFSGTLYCPGKMFLTRNLDESLEKRDGWNQAAIRANGDVVTLWLNGKAVGHCRDATTANGRVGIQIHGGDAYKGMKVAVQDIRVRVLSGEKQGAVPQAQPSPIQFTAHRVGSYRSESCGVGDFNKDGKLDIVAGPYWYEAPTWTAHSFRTLRGDVDEAGKGYRDDFMNAPLDVDGDGHLDVVTCCWFAKRMEWYRNPGTGGGEWPMQVVEQNGNFELGDLWDIDGDGRIDEILPAVKHTAWFDVMRGKDGKQGLVKYAVCSKTRPFGTGVGDINGDGRPDILRPTAWFEAPPDPRTGTWTENVWSVGSKNGGADHTAQILVYDVDADGLNDVVTSSAHKHGIFWYRQGREGKVSTWEQHVIDDTWSQAHSLALADFDGDGDLDLATGKRFMAHNGSDPDGQGELGVYWYELTRKPAVAWVKHVISYDQGIGSGLNICATDIDADNDIDLVVTGKWGGPVWFENNGK